MLNQLYYCICYIFSRLHVLQVDPSILEDLNRVNEKTVFKALTKFKSEKSDPTFSFISDCLSNSCDDLRGEYKGGGGHSPPLTDSGRGVAHPPEILRQKMFPI